MLRHGRWAIVAIVLLLAIPLTSASAAGVSTPMAKKKTTTTVKRRATTTTRPKATTTTRPKATTTTARLTTTTAPATTTTTTVSTASSTTTTVRVAVQGEPCSPEGATAVTDAGIPLDCSRIACNGTSHPSGRWRRSGCR